MVAVGRSRMKDLRFTRGPGNGGIYRLRVSSDWRRGSPEVDPAKGSCHVDQTYEVVRKSSSSPGHPPESVVPLCANLPDAAPG